MPALKTGCRMLEQRGIYLVNFNPNKGVEAGKIRPALVVQSNLLNELGHTSTVVMPLTTQLSSTDNVLRYRIAQRDSLERDSDVMLDQVRAIDNRRFCSERLTYLRDSEWQEVMETFFRLLQ